MLLSVCMIVQDSAAFISRSIYSIKKVADEIIIVDTGSCDRTKEVARDCGASVFSYKCNYDLIQARNYALGKAKGKWVLFLDVDEELSNDNNQLRIILDKSNKDGFYLPIINNYLGRDLDMPRLILRLFKSKRAYYYQGQINNNILPSILENNIEASIGVINLPIIHYKRLNWTGRNINRFRPENLFHLELINELNDSFAFLKNGIDYYREGRYTLAINELEKGLNLVESRYRYYFLSNLALIYLEFGNYNKANEVIKTGIIEYPEKDIFIFWSGYLDYIFKRNNKGINKLLSLLKKGLESNKIRGSIYLLLAYLYKNIKDYPMAEFYFKKTLFFHFNQKEIIYNLESIMSKKSGIDILNSLPAVDTYYNEYAFTLLEVYCNKGEYKKGLELLDLLQLHEGENEKLLYWRAILLMYLKQYRLAEGMLKQITPTCNKFEAVLDLLWIINLQKPLPCISKGVLNQLKLLGDRSKWQLINVFQEVHIYDRKLVLNFNNLTVKLRFYKMSLYYLDLFLYFFNDDKIDTLIRLIESLDIKGMYSDLGELFYKHKNWDKAYKYLNLSLKNGETIKDLLLLGNICFQNQYYTESKGIYKKILNLNPYYFEANEKFKLATLYEERELILSILHWKKSDENLKIRLKRVMKSINNIQEDN
jgi:glycosyltransferase involved in cell wall biosynthesis